MESEGYSYGRALGRKRVVVSNNGESSSAESLSSLKRMCSGNFNSISEKSRLEALPQDLLIRVLCGADHEDLNHIVQVSKTMKEASEIAKQMHFEFNTPKKNRIGFRGQIDAFEEVDTPNTPLKKSKARPISRKLTDISMALFTSEE